MDVEPIVNKVAESDLIVFDLEAFWDDREVVSLDLEPFLFKGLILKEKDFRERIRELDKSAFAGKHVAVNCSSNAVIPTWAYMLVAAKLQPVAASVGFGSQDDLVREQLGKTLASHDWSIYQDQNVIVKGCPSEVIPTAAYMEAVARLRDVAAKIMYGEACSSVPIWKRPAAVKEAGKAISASLPRTS